MKFAVDRSLDGRRYETDPIGPSLQRVLRYWTVRNKFEEARIHPDLRQIGVTSIRVEDEGLVFERDDIKPAENPSFKQSHVGDGGIGVSWWTRLFLIVGLIGIILALHFVLCLLFNVALKDHFSNLCFTFLLLLITIFMYK